MCVTINITLIWHIYTKSMKKEYISPSLQIPFEKRLSCLKIFRFSAAIVGSDPPAVTLESHEILCDNVIGTGGHFPAFRPLFLA